MDKQKPYSVTAPGGKTHLVVMNADDGLPAAFALMGTRAEKKVAIRITGGCKGMGPDDKVEMLSFFKKAFQGFKGIAFSGATRQVNEDGETDPMVTDVPGVIASLNEGSVALGTLPRTDILSLQEESRIVLDEWGTVPNPDMSGILIVQNGPDGKAEWDGDLNVYFGLMENWKKFAGFTQLGVCSWNGGAITEDEVMRSITNGWPTFLVKGTGRVTDEIIEKFQGDNAEFMKQLPNNYVIEVVDKNNPEGFRQALIKHGFIE